MLNLQFLSCAQNCHQLLCFCRGQCKCSEQRNQDLRMVSRSTCVQNSLTYFRGKDFNDILNLRKAIKPNRLECSTLYSNTSSHLIPQNDLEEGYFRINNSDIRYVKHGWGRHVLFFTYGVLGEIGNSFKKQLTAFDPNIFTSIFWDPPGYGKSHPRGRNFVPYQYIEEDLTVAHELLQRLRVSKVSLFGWCDGGHLSFLFALQYPLMVHKIVIWGTKSSLTRDNVKVFERMRHLSNWSPVARAETLKAYDNDSGYITGIFNQYVDMINVIFRFFNGNIYKELLQHVAAPALVLHSKDDVMVSEQQVRDLTKHLRECSYHQFGSGGHSCHIKHFQEFNKISKHFILDEKNWW